MNQNCRGRANASVQQILSAFVLTLVGSSAANAGGITAEDGGCNNGGTDIVTDRPDVTNSSVVVPRGAVQLENGINLTVGQGATVIDGSNSRLRIGVARCTEVLFDLPNYVYPLPGPMPAGFSDFSPAIKRQLGLLPGDIELSATVGLDLPIGTTKIAGPGYGAYVQFPWSKELADGWGLSGMFTTFWIPGEPASNPTLEATLAVERQIGSRVDFFVEYVVDHPLRGVSVRVLDSGGAYRVSPTQQIDIHVGVGLNRAAPDYLFGLGYSFRFDNLF